MLVLLVASFLSAIPGDIATASLQTSQQAATGNAPAKLSAAEISDLQKRADSGEATAQFALGQAYVSGNGVPQRPDQAALWYRKAAEQGNANAQNGLGVLYWLGDGVDKDKNQAVQWYRKAARQGNANAMFNLGAAYYNGEGVGRNAILAYAWFLLSGEAGSSSGQDAANRSQREFWPSAFNDACVAIAQMYEKGEDMPQDLPVASSWYRKAAERGDSEAQMGLAILLMKTNDYTNARHWCEIAVKQRNSLGFTCLGYLYQHGLGVDQSSKEAFNWYLQAAKAGNPGAIQTVGRMYASGEGTKVDRPEAFVWFFRLSRQKSDALFDAQKLRSVMTATEWKDTQKKLRQQGFDVKKVDEMLRAAPQPAQ